MTRICRLLKAEQGVALIAVMLAIFVLTVVVTAMAIATMGESNLSFNQLRGQQALAAAEAGAYRGLAELRRRLSVDLDVQIRQPSVVAATIQDICTAGLKVSGTYTGTSGTKVPAQIVSDYAWPIGPPLNLVATDWVLNGQTAILSIGTPASRIQMTDSASGTTIGDFYATIAVRWSGYPGNDIVPNPSVCQSGVNLPEQEVMWMDYAILSVGRSGNATKTLCLRSQFADRCANWFPTPSVAWQGSYALTGNTYLGWPVLIEKASYSQWALMLLDVGSVWLYTGTTINGPVHANTRVRIAGNPRLNDVVTQVQPDMLFRDCGSPVLITIPASNPNATLNTPGCDNTAGNAFGNTVTGGVPAIATPSNANPARTSTGITPYSDVTIPTDSEIRAKTLDPERGVDPNPLPDGVYVMNNCGSVGCGGIYVKGDVQQMVLISENNRQEILLSVATDPVAARRNFRISIDPMTKEIVTYWNYQACADPDPVAACHWGASRSTYGAGVFNGVIYVNGAILSNPDPSASSGLYGIVNKSMRMTIAAQQEIRITDQLVYEAPPAGPGHNPVNVLGVYSVTSNVTIDGNLTNYDTYVDAVVLAPTGKFWVDGWNSIIPPKGNVYSLGGTVQGTFGAFGGFGPLSGYGRVMTYDWRLRSNASPPFFPLTDIYTAVRWPSPAAVFTAGDVLYDRPQWEEIGGGL